jgi:cytochrome c biogenesis protein CcdA
VRDGDLVEAIGKHLGLPADRRMIAPSIYIGKHALIDGEINSSTVRAVLVEYAETGAPAFWEDLDVALGQQSILARFRTMGPLAVVVAALIDGINPCAFATIMLFVSYLAISRRKRADLLMIGLAFTAGVFITYLLVGLGAMSLLKLASTMRVLGLVLYSLMAVSCFVLAGLSVRDYLMARQGRLHDMKLNLPEPLRERIKVRIRAGRRASAGVAFVTGLIVSVLELACTGQVYLPTISFVVGIPEMRASATAYLVLYNVVFVIPLLVVLWLAAYGVSAKRFQDWFVQNAAKTKLIMAVLFVLLGFLLLSQVITL